MSSFLVVYASHFGQTRKIAERLALHLREHGHLVVVADAAAASGLAAPGDYDAVIIGSRVELGRHAPAIAQYMRTHAPSLRAMPTAFFSVSMSASEPGATTDPNGYMAAFFDQLGWRPTRAVAFAGALPYRQYNVVLRFVMKLISRAAHHPTDTTRDHEATDWNAVRAAAADFAALVPARAPTREEQRRVDAAH